VHPFQTYLGASSSISLSPQSGRRQPRFSTPFESPRPSHRSDSLFPSPPTNEHPLLFFFKYKTDLRSFVLASHGSGAPLSLAGQSLLPFPLRSDSLLLSFACRCLPGSSFLLLPMPALGAADKGVPKKAPSTHWTSFFPPLLFPRGNLSLFLSAQAFRSPLLTLCRHFIDLWA